jgi:hypothetical protein
MQPVGYLRRIDQDRVEAVRVVSRASYAKCGLHRAQSTWTGTAVGGSAASTRARPGPNCPTQRRPSPTPSASSKKTTARWDPRRVVWSRLSAGQRWREGAWRKARWVQLWLANEVADALAAIATSQQLDFKSAAPAALPAALHRGRRSGTPVPRTDIEPPGPIVGSCLPCLRSCSHHRRTPRHRAPTGDESTGLAR